MKNLSNEELKQGINKILESDSFNNELARDILKSGMTELLRRLAAGEEAVKKVAELEKDSERKADLFVKKCFECDEFERQAAAGQIAVDAMEKFSNKYKQWVSDYPKVVQKSKFFDDLIEMLQHKEALVVPMYYHVPEPPLPKKEKLRKSIEKKSWKAIQDKHSRR